MMRRIMTLRWFVLIASALIGMIGAADESFTQKFLGSPLLILAVLMVVDAVAFTFHRIRK